jgi:hypothetical protein
MPIFSWRAVPKTPNASQVTESDFDATPRRDLLALWLWLNDVPAERGAIRARSHRRFAPPRIHRAYQIR